MFKKLLNSILVWARKVELVTFTMLTVLGMSFFVGLAMFPPAPNATSLDWFITLQKLLGGGLIIAGVIGLCIRFRDMTR